MLLDLLFPPRCLGCRAQGAALCVACLASIARFPEPRCLRCDLPLPRYASFDLCSSCRRLPAGASALGGLRVVGPHTDLLREAIHALKYVGRRNLAPPLASLLAERWQAAGVPIQGIIPVPLHAARVRERGYNQSHLLAEPFARQNGLPLRAAFLQRVRPTPPQVGLDRRARASNVEGAFQAAASVAGGSWLLIDDVCTTGATLEACAGTLRAAGATAVWALTLARPHNEVYHHVTAV